MGLAGMADSRRRSSIKSKALAYCGPSPADPNAIKPASPYGWHYVVEAMSHCGMHVQALQIIRDYWGKMVNLGAGYLLGSL